MPEHAGGHESRPPPKRQVDPSSLDTSGEPSALEPEDWIRYCERRTGRRAPRLPPAGVQVLIRSLFDEALRRFAVTPDDFTQAGHPFAIVESGAVPFVLSGSAKGSSAAGGLEELIALGVRRVVVVGGAGALTDDIGAGDLVIATAALRDDGVSGHYEPTAPYTYPSPVLKRRLEDSAAALDLRTVSGPVWSMTAYFRQTPGRLEAFRRDGCIAVCNEAAAAFSIGRYRQVRVASLHVIGDSIAAGRFEVAHDPAPETLVAALDLAIEAATAPDGGRA